MSLFPCAHPPRWDEDELFGEAFYARQEGLVVGAQMSPRMRPALGLRLSRVSICQRRRILHHRTASLAFPPSFCAASSLESSAWLKPASSMIGQPRVARRPQARTWCACGRTKVLCHMFIFTTALPVHYQDQTRPSNRSIGSAGGRGDLTAGSCPHGGARTLLCTLSTNPGPRKTLARAGHGFWRR